MYNFIERKKLENNHKEIFERFEKVKLEIDQSMKNFEVKIAEMISEKKINSELKRDLKKLGSIIVQIAIKNQTEIYCKLFPPRGSK